MFAAYFDQFNVVKLITIQGVSFTNSSMMMVLAVYYLLIVVRRK